MTTGTTRLTLEPQDVWFFRTSRPFGAAQAASSAGEADLLPSPEVVFGLVRGALGNARDGWDWTAYRRGEIVDPLLGPPSLPDADRDWPADAVRVLGCLPAEIGDDGAAAPLFPAPAFLMADPNGEQIDANALRRAAPLDAPPAGGFDGDREGLQPTLPPDDGFRGRPADGFLTAEDFSRTLAGGLPSAVVPRTALAAEEPRVGIARDNSRRTTRRGQLYTLTAHRWHARAPWAGGDAGGGAADAATGRYGLLARVENVPAGEAGALALVHAGGERRQAWTRLTAEGPGDGWLPAETGPRVREAVAASRRWTLTLAAPAYFKSGWKPSWVNGGGGGAPHRANRGGIDLGRLVGFAAGPATFASGWDMAANRPKPARRLLSSGTSWFFEFDDAPTAAQLDALGGLQGERLDDSRAFAGFGLAFVGSWGESPPHGVSTPAPAA
ncbi:type III-B CRISPR module-associated Cmr3 family protein [Alienimonas californiensis]|uniref:CRISPR-associated protein (Cas_Cmr3) n=1 Tax=Alienimonas californiensis TaxID=2527989 RepID=A0A517P6P4_9PLAN|nr:type III-B CRISPR module-associated Cmr3 family protein [Alienimonas californiensis]QDT15047.1 CRISPR-associated protein (Cas_Cmr3) [Alienimonas californiensis]